MGTGGEESVRAEERVGRGKVELEQLGKKEEERNC